MGGEEEEGARVLVDIEFAATSQAGRSRGGEGAGSNSAAASHPSPPPFKVGNSA